MACGLRNRDAMDNAEIADGLDRIAELLAVQKGSAFRVRAYSAAAFSPCRSLYAKYWL